MLSIRDYLIVLITNTSHKTHLLSCALRYSSKLQKIQSLENFISMAIQGTQVPMYTKHTLFLYFSDFPIFFIWKKNKQHWKINNKNMLSKATKIDWLKRKTKHSIYAKTKTRRVRRSDRITWSPFPSILWKNLSVLQTLDLAMGGKNWNCSSSKGTWEFWVDLQ